VDIFRSGLAPLVPSVLQESWQAAVLWLVLALLGAAIQWISSRDVNTEEAYERGEKTTGEMAIEKEPESESEEEAGVETIVDAPDETGEEFGGESLEV
jgi:hypothetical protein